MHGSLEHTKFARTLDLDDLRHHLMPGQQAAGSCKKALLTGRERIHQCYLQGSSAATLLWLQTRLTDLLLLHLWREFLDETESHQLTLLAVGGYGRQELHPYSDIDISILVDAHLEQAIEEKLAQFVTALWDTGFEIGHSVRTIQECQEQAGQDATVVTNLMESRLLTGNATLFHTMLSSISPHNLWPPQAFFDAKMLEQAKRREKYQSDSYRLEPNLKQSNGGLRDIQTIFWVSQRVFGTRRWDDLVSQGLLSSNEFDTLISGLEFLWRVRYLLHHLAKRADDRLLFDYQREIAHEFGFTDDTHNLSIEQFMQSYFRHVTELQRLNDILLQGIGGIISGVTAASKPVPVNARFQVRNGFLEVVHERVFLEQPTALLEVFILYSKTPDASKLRANTVRLILSHLHLIDEEFRRNPDAIELFLQIFRSADKLTRCIRMMHNYGVLAAYLPAFSAIAGRMQYDLFHIYTVDEHTTRVIRNIRRLTIDEHRHELPHCSDVMNKITQPYLLYLAALFHDIAKGRGGDHSELGAVDALIFCQQHQLANEDCELVSWIVRHHLLMSMTAQRKDISDPDVVLEFASTVNSLDRLNNLYLLTIADIRATNPELWNSFKENLLRDLYESCSRVIQRGLSQPEDLSDVIALKKQEAKSLLLVEHGAAIDQPVELLWREFSEHYFQHHHAEEIVLHAGAILQHKSAQEPLVMLYQNSARGAMEVLVYVPDNDILFALITDTLSQLNLNILSAIITTTTHGFALNSFYVLDNDDERIVEQAQSQQIRDRLCTALLNPDELPEFTESRQSRLLGYFNLTPKIEFDNAVSAELTSVYIEAIDQPGILSLIARSFMQTNVLVRGAKIATFGERIEDVFLVSDQNGEKLQQAEQELLRQSLHLCLANNREA